MPIRTLQFLSLNEAENFTPSQLTVAISILSPRRAAAELHTGIADILRLHFHDGVPQGENPAGAILFSPQHAQTVIDFIRRHHVAAEPCHLLIHCDAGISRSAAVAVFAASECQMPLSGQFAFLNPWVLATLVKTAYPQYAFE